MRFTVQIINYLTAAYLEICIDSLLAAAKGYDVEILVSDNNSGDPDYPALASKYSNIAFETNEINLGFGAAHNELAKKATGNYLVILNPDIIVPETFFQKLLLTIETNPEFGAIGCRMINGSGTFLKESKRGAPTIWNSFCYFSKLSLLFPKSKVFAGYHVGWIPERALSVVPVLSGACMVLLKSTYLNEGGFDERFFMYGEDVELSERLLKKGYKNYYQGGLTVLHYKGRSSAQKAESIKYFYNAIWVYWKIKLGISKDGIKTSKFKGVSESERSILSRQKEEDQKRGRNKEIEVGTDMGYAQVIEYIETKKESGIVLTKKGCSWALSPKGKLPRFGEN
ncbi:MULTISPECIES: glycosyltransferase family 2 protein [unclassified Paraflavitalea]|uniref:glycosyltransferase family 2 protein n=1 Tax=unclassified Paraflavitalea TaxID=2798305 RepID=UPI003D356162